MRSVRIDFVEPKAWKFIWAAATLVVLAIAAATGVKVLQLRLQRVVLEQQLAALQVQQMQWRAQAQPAASSQDNPRAASEAAARRLLQRDWNRLYDAIETPALAKVRLVQLTMDAGSGQVVLEYELESMAQAAVVTRALNDASRPQGVWQLDRLESAGQGDSVGSGRVKGIWRAVFE